MAPRPALHALFHSVASLGYIPFALTSVLLSSSSPYVSLTPINIILVAFVPPLTIFPLLCFSYRYLERFPAISLTVQRARTYIMLAGSGLCLLVAAHLMMVHLVNNGQNSTFNPTTVPSSLLSPSVAPEAPVQPQQQSVVTEAVAPDPQATALYLHLAQENEPKAAATAKTAGNDPTWLMEPILIPDLLEATLNGVDYASSTSVQSNQQGKDEPAEGRSDEERQKRKGFKNPSTLLLPLEHGPGSFESRVNNQRRASENWPEFKSLVPSHLLHSPATTSTTTDTKQPQPQLQLQLQQEPDLPTTSLGIETSVKQEERDFSSSLQQTFVIDQQQSVTLSEGVPITDLPLSAPAETLESSTEPVTHSSSDSGTSTVNKFFPIPPLDAQSFPPSFSSEKQSSEPSNGSSSLDSSDGASTQSKQPRRPRGSPLFFANKDRISMLLSGYDVAGIHWIVFIASHGLLLLLLVLLFLGVLILTEYVLDREEEDIAQFKYLYWGRVVGIASATVVSAIHGSLLSGYVLLDGVSDWIAKAAVGAICGYWLSMTWIMNRVTGPLPY